LRDLAGGNGGLKALAAKVKGGENKKTGQLKIIYDQFPAKIIFVTYQTTDQLKRSYIFSIER